MAARNTDGGFIGTVNVALEADLGQVEQTGIEKATEVEELPASFAVHDRH